MSEERRLNRVIQITLKTEGPDTKEAAASISKVLKSVGAASIGAGALGSIKITPEHTITRAITKGLMGMDVMAGEAVTEAATIGASIAFPPAALINLAFAGMMLTSMFTGGKV